MRKQIDYIITQLRGYYPEEELRELAYWIVEETTGLSRTQILMQTQSQVIPHLGTILQRLRNQGDGTVVAHNRVYKASTILEV